MIYDERTVMRDVHVGLRLNQLVLGLREAFFSWLKIMMLEAHPVSGSVMDLQYWVTSN